MAAEAVEWQKLGLRNLPLSAGQIAYQCSVFRNTTSDYYR